MRPTAITIHNVSLGARGSRRNRRPTSWGSRSSLWLLHRRQAATTFSQTWRPPRERGTTWSTFSARSPQYWQTWSSRTNTARLDNPARALKGTFTKYRRRMTLGAGSTRLAPRTGRAPGTSTSAFSLRTSTTARRTGTTQIGWYDAFRTSARSIPGSRCAITRRARSITGRPDSRPAGVGQDGAEFLDRGRVEEREGDQPQRGGAGAVAPQRGQGDARQVLGRRQLQRGARGRRDRLRGRLHRGAHGGGVQDRLDPASAEPPGAGAHRSADRPGPLGHRLGLDLVARGAPDRPCHPGAEPALVVGGVHDRVDLEVGDVTTPQPQLSRPAAGELTAAGPNVRHDCLNLLYRGRGTRGPRAPRPSGRGPTDPRGRRDAPPSTRPSPPGRWRR